MAIVLAGWIAAGEAQAQTTVTSTEQDQKELAVTVYNSNVALVRDVRRVRLPEGTIDLRYMDIAAQVNPATVHIVSLTAPKELNVLEQDYEYDLLSPQKLSAKIRRQGTDADPRDHGKQFHQGSSREGRAPGRQRRAGLEGGE